MERVAGSTPGPVSLDFPLRGEWVALRSPADRVPSHGSGELGQAFAFDFARPDPRHPTGVRMPGGIRAALAGVPVADWPGWGEPVLAPRDGVVVAAVDDVPEPATVHLVRDQLAALRTTAAFHPDATGFRRVAGNHVILDHGAVWTAFAHLATGSVAVRAGGRVRAGEPLGRLGHTGNSTFPHLHVQAMDGPDPLKARGVPCVFRAYEVLTGGSWTPVSDGIPSSRERIRAVAR